MIPEEVRKICPIELPPDYTIWNVWFDCDNIEFGYYKPRYNKQKSKIKKLYDNKKINLPKGYKNTKYYRRLCTSHYR